MKSLIFTLVLILGSFANAMMSESSRYTATQCGYPVFEEDSRDQNIWVEAVCTGFIESEKEQIIAFYLTNGEVKYFGIDHKSNLFVSMPAGSKKTVFHLVDPNGTHENMLVIQNRDGLLNASGSIEGLKFNVTEFFSMFAMQ